MHLTAGRSGVEWASKWKRPGREVPRRFSKHGGLSTEQAFPAKSTTKLSGFEFPAARGEGNPLGARIVRCNVATRATQSHEPGPRWSAGERDSVQQRRQADQLTPCCHASVRP